MGDLSKSVAVLDLTLVLHTRSVTFARIQVGAAEDNAPGSVQSVEISHEAWKEMGEPKQVTVTVEPGDRLNKVVVDAGFLRHMEPVNV